MNRPHKMITGQRVDLREMRFDTPQASQLLLGMSTYNKGFQGEGDAVRLPPNHQSVSKTPHSGGLVWRAYPHGLMLGAGMGSTGGGLLLIAMYIFLYWISDGRIWPGAVVTHPMLFAFAIFIYALLFLPVVWIVGLDCIGYRFHTSILFNRKIGKVHVFQDRSLLWKPWRYEVKTFDWKEIRAEIDTVRYMTAYFRGEQATLRIVVLQGKEAKALESFSLGTGVEATHLQPLLDCWEHLRRFMQNEGPLFADDDDQPNPTAGRETLWECMSGYNPFEPEVIKGSLISAWKHHSFNDLMLAVLSIILLPAAPLAMTLGIFPYIASRLKLAPKWPVEILASVGGAELSGKALDEWRHVVAGAQTPVVAPEGAMPPTPEQATPKLKGKGKKKG